MTSVFSVYRFKVKSEVTPLVVSFNRTQTMYALLKVSVTSAFLPVTGLCVRLLAAH